MKQIKQSRLSSLYLYATTSSDACCCVYTIVSHFQAVEHANRFIQSTNMAETPVVVEVMKAEGSTKVSLSTYH